MKGNKILAMVFALVSIALGVAVYFDRLVTPAIVVVAVVALFTVFIVMMHTCYYQEWYDYNPVKFWRICASVSLALLVIALCIVGFEKIPEKLGQSLLATFIPIVASYIVGVLLGNIGRVFFRKDKAIW